MMTGISISAAHDWKPATKAKRLGFTLVELLVVIAIIALLISLLLPAVQQARETARRIQCSNNARQLALSLLNYESANNQFPPPGHAGINREPSITFGDFVPHVGKQISWIVLTLPFMEEQALYDRFDLNKSVFEQETNPAGAQPPSLLCPSDSAEGRFVSASFTQDVPLGKGNYAAWASPYHVDLQQYWPGALGSWGLELKEVEDGLSKTLMISEVRTRAEITDQRGAWAVPWNASSLLAYDAHHDLSNGLRFWANDEATFFMQRPNHQGPNLDTLYSCTNAQGAQLEKMPCATFKLGGGDASYLSSAPRSNHIEGVNVTFMDGAAKFITNDIDPLAMAYQISISDGRAPDESE